MRTKTHKAKTYYVSKGVFPRDRHMHVSRSYCPTMRPVPLKIVRSSDVPKLIDEVAEVMLRDHCASIFTSDEATEAARTILKSIGLL